jgi:hypothetical protein
LGAFAVPIRIVRVAFAEPVLTVVSNVGEILAAMNQLRAQAGHSQVVFPILLEPQIAPRTGGIADASSIQGGRGVPPTVEKDARQDRLEGAPGSFPWPIDRRLPHAIVAGVAIGHAALRTCTQSGNLNLELARMQQIVAVEVLNELATREPPAGLSRHSRAGVLLSYPPDDFTVRPLKLVTD